MTPGAYGRRFRKVPMGFEVVAEEETEDHYVITLSFRPQGDFAGTPGQEQFFIEKEGAVAIRPVLSEPVEKRGIRFPVIGIGVLVVAGLAAGGLFASGVFNQEITPTPTPTPVPTLRAAGPSEPVGVPVVSIGPAKLVSPQGVTVEIQTGSVDEDVQLWYQPLFLTQIPQLPEGYVASQKLFDLSVTGAQRPAGDKFSFVKPITITVGLSAEDAVMANGLESNVVIQHYRDSEAQWISLDTTVDFRSSVARAQVDSLSIFALTIREQPATPTPVPLPTATPIPTPTPTVTPTHTPIDTPTPTPIPDTGGGLIRPGQTVAAAIDTEGDTDDWTFRGIMGDLVTISLDADQARRSNLDPVVELLAPGGTLEMDDDDGGVDVNALISNWPLQETGTYTIRTRGFGSSSGAYSLSLVVTLPPTPSPTPTPIPDTGGGRIDPGQTVAAAIDTDGDIDDWTFQGIRGELVTISLDADQAGRSELDPVVELLAPGGTLEVDDDDGGVGANSLISEWPLRETGTYTIKATGFGSSSGAYNLSLIVSLPPTPSPTPTPIPDTGGGRIDPGQTVTAAIDTDGDIDDWTFSGVRGDLVTISVDHTP